MILKLKAKVMLVSEEQMEAQEQYDLGEIAKSKEWVWRQIGVCVEDVYRVIEYTKSKTMVLMNDGEKIIVSEVFDHVFNKWDNLKKSTMGYDIPDKEDDGTTTVAEEEEEG